MNIKYKVVAALAAVVLVLPGISLAQTTSASALQAQIAALLAQIQLLQSQLNTQGSSTITPGTTNGITPGTVGSTISTGTSCYSFSTNLSIGMSGAAITALQTALQKDGESVQITGKFDDQTAAAVTALQEKYASQILSPYGLTNGTGYAGKSTRAELNTIFGCGRTNPTPAPVTTTSTPPVVCPAWGCNGPEPVSPVTPIVPRAVAPSLTVGIDPNTPPAGYITQNSTGNTLAVFRFTDNSNSEGVVVSRLNVIDAVANSGIKATFSNVSLYNGSTLLGVAAAPVLDSAGTGYIYTFNLSTPLVISQGSSVSLALKGDAGSYVNGSLTDGSNSTFEIVTTSDSTNNASALAVVARGATSNESASVNLSSAIGNPQTVVRTTLSVSGQSVSNFPSASFQQLGSVTFTANSSGDAEISSLKLTTNQTNSAFLSSLVLKDPSGNDIVSVDNVAQSSVSGSNVTWTFSRSTNPLIITAGSSYTLSVWGNLADVPVTAGAAQTIIATIASPTDVSYYDGTNSSALLLNLSSSQTPVTVVNITSGVSGPAPVSTGSFTSFIINPTSIASGQLAAVSFSASNLSQVKTSLSCPSGVTAPDGHGGDACSAGYIGEFPSAASGNTAYQINNSTGNSQQVLVTFSGYNSANSIVAVQKGYITVAAAVVSTSPALPTLIGVNPTQGMENTTVTLTGANLTGATAVNFYNQSNQEVAGIAQQNLSVSSGGSSLSFALNGAFCGMVSTGVYQIKAITPAGTSNGVTFSFTSCAVIAPTSTVVSTPTVSQVQNLSAAVGGSYVNLSWSAATASNGIGGYNVYRSTSPSFVPSSSNLIGQTNTNSYVDGVLSPERYYYVVMARDVNGNLGPASAQVSAAVAAPAPTTSGPPTLQLLVDGSPQEQTFTPGTSLYLTWNSGNTTSCSVSGQNQTIWSGSVATSGSVTLAAPNVAGTYVYQLTCTGGTPGTSITNGVQVQVSSANIPGTSQSAIVSQQLQGLLGQLGTLLKSL